MGECQFIGNLAALEEIAVLREEVKKYRDHVRISEKALRRLSDDMQEATHEIGRLNGIVKESDHVNNALREENARLRAQLQAVDEIARERGEENARLKAERDEAVELLDQVDTVCTSGLLAAIEELRGRLGK